MWIECIFMVIDVFEFIEFDIYIYLIYKYIYPL